VSLKKIISKNKYIEKGSKALSLKCLFLSPCNFLLYFHLSESARKTHSSTISYYSTTLWLGLSPPNHSPGLIPEPYK